MKMRWVVRNNRAASKGPRLSAACWPSKTKHEPPKRVINSRQGAGSNVGQSGTAALGNFDGDSGRFWPRVRESDSRLHCSRSSPTALYPIPDILIASQRTFGPSCPHYASRDQDSPCQGPCAAEDGPRRRVRTTGRLTLDRPARRGGLRICPTHSIS